MIRESDTAEYWFGLCRKPPVIHTFPAGIDLPLEPALEGRPDGGGGPGTIRRGIGAALSGMRTLNRNRQLLWFTLLGGLVLAGNAVGQAAFYYIQYNLQMPLDRIVWQFFIEFASLFCMVFLFAGLVLRIPSNEEGTATFFQGLAGVRKYLKAIFLWSLVLALAGMLIVWIFFTFPSPLWWPRELWLYNIFGHFDTFLFNTLSQFPFNLTRLPPPDIFTEIPGYGGRTMLLWVYFGFREALIFSAINLLLLILTPFVVPLIVLQQKTLIEAVAGSFTILKKAWAEVAACAALLGIVVFGMSLPFLFVQGAHGMVIPLRIYYHPTDMWIALGFLYDLALFSVAFVVATIGGIAALEICTSAKNGHMPGSPEPHS